MPPAWCQGSREASQNHTFSDFLACLSFYVFVKFLDAIFIDFGTPRWRANAVNYNGNSRFSCYEKVIVLAHFWPPKMSPKAQKSSFFELLQLLIFMFFRDVRF